MSATDHMQKQNFNRYAGKPFLAWVDSFILKAIGHLDPEMEAKLERATPDLRKAFSSEGSWEDIVMEQLDYTPEVRGAIQELWAENQALAYRVRYHQRQCYFTENFALAEAYTVLLAQLGALDWPARIIWWLARLRMPAGFVYGKYRQLRHIILRLNPNK